MKKKRLKLFYHPPFPYLLFKKTFNVRSCRPIALKKGLEINYLATNAYYPDTQLRYNL